MLAPHERRILAALVTALVLSLVAFPGMALIGIVPTSVDWGPNGLELIVYFVGFAVAGLIASLVSEIVSCWAIGTAVCLPSFVLGLGGLVGADLSGAICLLMAMGAMILGSTGAFVGRAFEAILGR